MPVNKATPSLELLRHIIVDASRARNQVQLVDCIVRHVQRVYNVPVCSLYLLDNELQELRLIATLGLDSGSVDKVRLALGQGLIGRIADSQLPILQDRASSHPDYRYFPETGEASFDAFLGVPIVHHGNTLGVLVLQDTPPRQFDNEDEAFLVTLSAQLASSLLRWTGPTVSDAGAHQTQYIEGIKGAAGLAVGKLYFVSKGLSHGPADSAGQIDPVQELSRFQAAVKQTRVDLNDASIRLRSSVSAEILEVFDFYQMMLGSEQLGQAIEERISQGDSAVSALRRTVDECALVFEAMPDPYFQARGEDVRNVGNRLYYHLQEHLPEHHLQDPHHPKAGRRPTKATSGVILIGDQVSVTDIGQFEPEQLAAIICMKGSALSHTAALASGLGIPAVMGIKDISGLQQGDLVAVDGYRGRLIVDPSPVVLQRFEQQINEQRQQQQRYFKCRHLPAETLDGFRIRLLANTGLRTDITPGLARGAEGVGLYRSEIPFMAQPNFPSEEEQLEIYQHLLSTYQPLPVTMRTLDIGGDKSLPYFSYKEDNPGLGWRGIRFTLDNRPVFICQLRAMLRSNATSRNLRIMLPMVSRLDEVLDTIELLDIAEAQLTKEGLDFYRPPLGIMVEVPAAITLLPFMAPYIDFISIGSNDLSQYLLAVDRNNPRVASRFDSLHPAVLHTLVALVKEANRLRLEVSLCGEMASDPLAVVLLLGMGIETLSLSSFSLPKIKHLIRHLHRSDAERWLTQALKLGDEADIRQLLTAELTRCQLSDVLAPAESVSS